MAALRLQGNLFSSVMWPRPVLSLLESLLPWLTPLPSAGWPSRCSCLQSSPKSLTEPPNDTPPRGSESMPPFFGSCQGSCVSFPRGIPLQSAKWGKMGLTQVSSVVSRWPPRRYLQGMPNCAGAGFSLIPPLPSLSSFLWSLTWLIGRVTQAISELFNVTKQTPSWRVSATYPLLQAPPICSWDPLEAVFTRLWGGKSMAILIRGNKKSKANKIFLPLNLSALKANDFSDFPLLFLHGFWRKTYWDVGWPWKDQFWHLLPSPEWATESHGWLFVSCGDLRASWLQLWEFKFQGSL